jgi:predicted amino acid-binding ACT domain protein
MRFKMTKMDVWVAEIDDQPGALARAMKAAADYGADLDCVVARRHTDKPGKGVVFMTPLKGKEQLDHASDIGLHRATHLATLKVEGPDRPGFGAELTKAVAEAGVNLHGFTAAVIGRRFVCYAGFDTIADMERAQDAITALGAQTHRSWRELISRKKREPEKVKVPA